MLEFGYTFNRTGSIQEKSASYSNGQRTYSWANKYTGVKSRELPPLKGGEGIEDNQIISEQKRSWLIMKSGRVITPDMRYVVNSVNHYIVGVRDYKGSLNMLVLDTIEKDNDTAQSPVTSLTVGNGDQTKASGAAIDTITLTADQPATFFATDLPSGCTLSVTSSTVATITGTAPSSTSQFSVTAIGGGGVVSKTIDIQITSVGSFVTALLLTQAEYDGLGSYDGSIYYLISDA